MLQAKPPPSLSHGHHLLHALVTPGVCHSPLWLRGDTGERWLQAVQVEGHVTLVTQQLFLGSLTPTTNMAGALATWLVFIILAELAGWATLPCFPEGRRGCSRPQCHMGRPPPPRCTQGLTKTHVVKGY